MTVRRSIQDVQRSWRAICSPILMGWLCAAWSRCWSVGCWMILSGGDVDDLAAVFGANAGANVGLRMLCSQASSKYRGDDKVNYILVPKRT